MQIAPAAAAKHARKRGTDTIGQTRAERAEPSDDRTVRGQCPACERPVFSTDDGRFSLRGTYYHAECEQMGSLTRFWKRKAV